ncbi:MAG TPA: ATP-binding protein [Bryobacteraceae bacterium]|jgi:PAS domain S-box-containing protein|nr:ATP-binding protein [Bryobacteraceae bacterium]
MNRVAKLKNRFWASLLMQALAATIVLLTVSAVLRLGVSLFIQDRVLERQLELRGESMAQFLARELQFSLLVGDRGEMQRLLEDSAANEDVLFVEVLNPAGQRVCALARADRFKRIPALAAGAALGKPETSVRYAGERFVEIRVPVLAPARDRLLDWEPARENRSTLGALRMGISMQKQRTFARQMLLDGLWAMLFGTAMMCAAQYWGLRRLLRPLGTLVEFTNLVGTGDLRHRAPVDRADEVGQLAAAFNSMVERLGETTVSKDYVDNVLRSMGEALIVTDRAGRIERVNPRTVELLGYAEAELIGRPALSLVAEGETPPSAAGIERSYRARDGRLIPVWLSSAGLRGAAGAAEGYVWLAQDMTELKRTQGELVRARDAAEQANRAKSVFLANMSHELRTPLNAVIGYSQMLREDYIGAEQEEVRGDLEKIERSGQMLLGIINDILDLSKIEAGRETVKAQQFDVAAVLQDVSHAVQPLARLQGDVLEIDCPDHARMAYADLPKFRQSVLNLVNNALKFTERGRVSVAVNKLRDADGEWTEVHVSDTGIGIGRDQLGKLFQPFSQVDGSATRKYDGTGLGLAISKKFCQMMGGDITVESELGRGSRFSIRLPASGTPDGQALAGGMPSADAGSVPPAAPKVPVAASR